jgi:hypothetical protein
MLPAVLRKCMRPQKLHIVRLMHCGTQLKMSERLLGTQPLSFSTPEGFNLATPKGVNFTPLGGWIAAVDCYLLLQWRSLLLGSGVELLALTVLSRSHASCQLAQLHAATHTAPEELW